jgi:uncharacterized protein YciI
MDRPLHDWLVQLPDKSGVLPTRMQHLAAHMQHNKPNVEAGTIVMSGPTLSSHPKSAGEGLAMTGSVMLWRAASEEEVWRSLKEDPYAREGVWDLDKATVTPYYCGVRKAL